MISPGEGGRWYNEAFEAYQSGSIFNQDVKGATMQQVFCIKVVLVVTFNRCNYVLMYDESFYLQT